VGPAPYSVEPGVRKIAVLRANAVGDFLFTLPAIEALRRAYPEAELVLLAADWHEDFLAGRPGPVDRVIALPPSRGVRGEPHVDEDAAELERFFARMVAEDFGLVVQMHGGGRYSNPFVRRLGGRLTVGARAPDAPALDRWVRYVLLQPEVLRWLEVVSLVGASAVGLEPSVAVTSADLAEAEAALEGRGGPLVAIHPGAIDARRRWPVEKFARVGDALAAEGATVVVTGTEAEADLAGGVVEAMDADAHNLSGRLSLGGLAGLMSLCRVAVANDTGPLHLAAAVGAATTGIFWGINMVNTAPLTRARHRALVSWRFQCPVCGRSSLAGECGHRPSFVADVGEEGVVAEALDLLSSG
jgi:ADP-heptose:LPS heptosyltransferase